jgi:hypothetical protein
MTHRNNAGEDKLVLSVALRRFKARKTRLQRHTTDKKRTIYNPRLNQTRMQRSRSENGRYTGKRTTKLKVTVSRKIWRDKGMGR